MRRLTMDFPALDFDDVHRRTLPARLATELGRAAGHDVAGVRSIAFRLPGGRAYRFAPDAGAIRIDAGDDAATVVELDESAWRDFANEIATAAGLLYGGRLRFVSGGSPDLERWEPALRALYSERPIFDPLEVALTDPAGAPLDPGRSFALHDPAGELRHFLHATGYLHVRGVFTPAEIARLVAVVERYQTAARPGDGRSWWAKRADGGQVLCRLIYLGLVSPEIVALGDDARIARLAALGGEGLRPATDRSDGHSVVIKNADVVDGLSDLPWHRDCGLGGHPVTCPTINIGIQLDAATAASRRLHFVPGSWKGSCHRSDLSRARTVAIDTAPGDCTVHFGDVMHAAPPPTGSGPGRRALYLTCMPERAYDAIPPGKSYNDVILARVGQ
ncbi:MAG: phytanoyl-CoA dioxygenase family protein [Candidatus Binatia bacterium]